MKQCFAVTIKFFREGEQALVRLAQMTRGIGDPLIAAYTRMFVCRMGVDVAPTLTQYIATSIKDFLHTLTQVQVSLQADQPMVIIIMGDFFHFQKDRGPQS